MKGQIVQQVLPLAVVPVVLILSLIIFSNVDTTFRESDLFLVTITNETLGTVDSSTEVLATSRSYVDIASNNEQVYLWNTSANNGTRIFRNSSASCAQSCYTIQDTPGASTADLVIHPLTRGSLIRANITYSTWDANTNTENTFTTLGNNSFSGFDLAGILPIVIAGVIILGIILGAFAFRRQ